MKEKIKKVIAFFGNPHLLLCFALAWIVTNGWSYIMLGLGTLLGVDWMIAVASVYLAFLWLPISPEKIVTVGLAMGLLRFLFPEDQKTLAVLREMLEKFKTRVKNRRKKATDQEERGEKALVLWKKNKTKKENA